MGGRRTFVCGESDLDVWKFIDSIEKYTARVHEGVMPGHGGINTTRPKNGRMRKAIHYSDSMWKTSELFDMLHLNVHAELPEYN
jgi:hypothetical protein